MESPMETSAGITFSEYLMTALIALIHSSFSSSVSRRTETAIASPRPMLENAGSIYKEAACATVVPVNTAKAATKKSNGVFLIRIV